MKYIVRKKKMSDVFVVMKYKIELWLLGPERVGERIEFYAA